MDTPAPAPGWFVGLIADDEGTTYDPATKTIEYTAVLVELRTSPDGPPCTLLEWFTQLWKEPDPAAWVEASLGIDRHSLDTIYLTEFEGIPPSPHDVDTWPKLGAWLEQKVSVERGLRASEHAFEYGDTIEFDNQFAFLAARADAVSALSPPLQQIVAFDATTGRLRLLAPTLRASAYLD